MSDVRLLSASDADTLLSRLDEWQCATVGLELHAIADGRAVVCPVRSENDAMQAALQAGRLFKSQCPNDSANTYRIGYLDALRSLGLVR